MYRTFERSLIDDAFIAQWAPRYDEIESDELEYQAIVLQVHREIAAIGTLTEATFTRILDWKSPRTKGHVDWSDYGVYPIAINVCLGVPEDEKLPEICLRRGIGACVGSTFLHFIYPDAFPIFDIRTVETLLHFGHDIFKSRGKRQYPLFKSNVVGIQTRLLRWNLREIDRALFAFHKVNPEIFGNLSRSTTGRACPSHPI